MCEGFELVLTPDNRVVFQMLDPAGAVSAPPISVAGTSQDVVVVVLGRLTDRPSLPAHVFNPASPTPPSDAELVLSLYRQGGGDNLPRYLDGEYSIAIADTRRRVMLAIRDPLGNWPLYWSRSSGEIRVSSSLGRLADWTGRELDPGYMAEFLMAPVPLAELPTSSTPYAGVSRVAPGELIEARPRLTHRRHWWDWSSMVGTVAVRSVRDGIDAWRERLNHAVAERVSWGPTALRPSDGPAASLLMDVSRTLQGDVAVLDPVRLSSGLTKPMQPAPHLDEPMAMGLLAQADQHLADAAQSQGARVLMTDRGGDMLMCSGSPHCLSVFLHATLRRLLTSASQWWYAGRGTTSEVPAWIDPSFARRESLGDIARQHAQSLLGPSSRWLWHVRQAVGDPVAWSIAAPRGLLLTHPYRDVQLTAYGLGLAAACPNSRVDQLGALGQRPRRPVCPWMAPAQAALRRHHQHLHEMLADAAAADSGWIDHRRLAAELDRAVRRVMAPKSLHQLMLGLALVSWLNQVQQTEAAAPRTSDVA